VKVSFELDNEQCNGDMRDEFTPDERHLVVLKAIVKGFGIPFGAIHNLRVE